MSVRRNIARTYLCGVLGLLLVVFALGGMTVLGDDRHGVLPGGEIGWWRQGEPVQFGSTFCCWPDGAPFTAADAVAIGVWDGIDEYVKSAGYDCRQLYTQHIYVSPSSYPLGFTFSQYMAEIDAGRTVLIQIEGLTMLGSGYDEVNGLVYVYDTLSRNGQNPAVMTWGGSYNGTPQWGVTVMEPVPEPSTIVLLVAGACGLFIYGYRRRKRAA